MQTQNTYNEWLIYRIRTGDKSAFKLLAEMWYAKLVKHIYLIVKDKEVAKDIAQDTWSVVIIKLNNLKEPAYFKVWLFKIARNKSVDWIKQESKKRQYKDEIRNTTDELDETNEPDSDVLELRKALRKLSESEQQILNLFYLENCNIREINKILGIPVGTVKSRLFNAREHLKVIINR